MEISNRQLVSDINTELKLLNIDERLSNRFLLSRLKDKVRYYIKQDLDSRRLFKITKVWRKINCFEMCPASLVECCIDVPNCQTVMKSRKKLPATYDSNYGTLIKVFSLNGDKEFTQIRIGDYKDIKNREYQDPNKKYFWVDNGYIVIPDSEVEAVFVIGLFQNPEEVDKLNDEKDSNCLKPLDSLFPCPEHLLEISKKDLLLELGRLYKGIVEDNRPDNNSINKQ